MFCKNCGYQIDKGSIFCSHCGQRVGAETQSSDSDSAAGTSSEGETRSYKKYVNQVKMINIISCMICILTIILVFALIFAPIFKFSYKVESIEEWEKIMGRQFEASDLLDMLNKGTNVINGKFSLFDGIKMLVGNFFEKFDGNSSEYGALSGLLFLSCGIFPLFSLIMAFIIIVVSYSQLYSAVHALIDPDKSTLLEYSEIKKSGNVRGRQGFLEGQYVISLVLLIFFDISIAKVIQSVLPSDIIKELDIGFPCYMVYFTGFSNIAGVIICGLVAYFAAKSIKKRRLSELVYEVNQEDV